MDAPIFLPAAPNPSPDVLAAERAILDAEGPYQVDGRSYARSSDADQQRRLAAERRVREAARREARAEHAMRGDGAIACPAIPPVRPVVATWLTPRERARVDVAKADDLVVPTTTPSTRCAATSRAAPRTPCSSRPRGSARVTSPVSRRSCAGSPARRSWRW